MANYQQLTLVGYLGGDPEVVTFKTGNKVVKARLAVTERGYKTQNGVQIPDHTEWFSLEFFQGLADVVEKYIRKGSQIMVVGKQRTEVYEKDGQKRYTTKVIVDKMQLFGNAQSKSDNTANAPVGDDLPF